MSWTIVIPSHNRSESINKRTLLTLAKCGIPASQIKVYVVSEEIEKYREAIDPSVEVREGAIGCIGNRTAILNSFSEESHLVFMDDDITDIITTCDFAGDHGSCCRFAKDNFGSQEYIKQKTIGVSLGPFIDKAFDTMIAEGVFLGGVNAFSNGYFNKHSYQIGLNHICGGFYFEIVRKDQPHPTNEFAEDFNRSLQYFKRDGKTIKFQFIGIKTPCCTGKGDSKKDKGGMCDDRTVEVTRIAVHKCAEEFPGLVSIIPPTPGRKFSAQQFWNMKCKRQKSNVNKEWI